MAKASPAKRQKIVEEISPSTVAGPAVVPTLMPAAAGPSNSSPSVPTVQAPPTLPATKDGMFKCDVDDLMRRVIKYSRKAIVDRIKGDEALNAQLAGDEFWMNLPLRIKAVDDHNSMVGYKAPWSKAEATTSINGKDMYEAAINIDWIKPFCNSTDAQALAGDMPTYEDLLLIEETTFTVDPAILASSQGEIPKEYRKSFPYPLATYVAEKDHVLRDAFHHSLVLLDGHGLVWGWWLHLYRLLTGTDLTETQRAAAIRHHLDVGLSATAQVRVETDMSRLPVWASERSGKKQVTEKTGTDTFPAFAKKLMMVLRDVPPKTHLDYLKKVGSLSKVSSSIARCILLLIRVHLCSTVNATMSSERFR